jgi:uncharacterized protein (UPF0332 family)
MQSNLIKKSNENYESAKLLIANKYYTSSIHCLYYSILQQMKLILIKEYSINDNLIKQKGKDIGTHNFLKSQIYSKLNKKSADYGKIFLNYFSTLKKLRINADYKNIIFDLRKTQKALKLTENLEKILTENFNYES